MATCANCGTELSTGLDFCTACGTPVPTDVAVPEAVSDMPPPPVGAVSPPVTPHAPAASGGFKTAQEEWNWGMFTHLSGLIALISIPSPIGPLILWMMRKEQSSFIDRTGKEALNFQISMLLYGLVSAILIFALIGLLLLPIVLITWFVLTIIGGIRVGKGEEYTYPFTIRFVK